MQGYAQKVELIELKSKVFKNTRSLRIYLPPGYEDVENVNKKYPILYMNDGIATFHAYQLEQILTELIHQKKIPPIIIVGIDNGASTKESTNPIRDRANEYLPWPDLSETNPDFQIEHPQGNKYPEFLFKEVMPLVKKHYRISNKPENIGLGGASRGALIALYTAIKKQGKIGYLLLESPSLYVFNKQILIEAKKWKKLSNRIYIGIGTKEGDSEAIQAMAVDDARQLEQILQDKGMNNNVKIIIEAEATHDYDAFARRFPIALAYLFAK
ncbi:MAG: alpha/beta hydrolase [Saprospiraceae bacterium]|nr:alpha/beta hydrolase [Saprospiraceae bacterium]